MSELILYQIKDGKAEVRLRAEDGSAWLTQGEIAELFATTKQNVSLHAANVLKEGELAEQSVVKESLTTAADGRNYRTKLYRLEMILAIRGTSAGKKPCWAKCSNLSGWWKSPYSCAPSNLPACEAPNGLAEENSRS